MRGQKQRPINRRAGSWAGHRLRMTEAIPGQWVHPARDRSLPQFPSAAAALAIELGAARHGVRAIGCVAPAS